MQPDWFHLECAARAIGDGGVAAAATEAVWGLSCDPFDRDAVLRVLALKRRPVQKGLIVIAADADVVAPALAALTQRQRRRVRASWPGAVTWLLPALDVPYWIHGEHARVAVRVPAHAQARRLCAAAGGLLVSTSANPSGRPPARTALGVRQYFGAAIDYVLPGAVGSARAPSTIRDAVSGAVLRAG